VSSDSMAPSDAVIRAFLASRPVIAIVGASPKPERPSHGVMTALLEAGYEVVPVHPAHATIQGRRAYPDLRSIPGKVDLVDVFRRPEYTPDVAREAVARGARMLWLQLRVVSWEAHRIAAAGGLWVVMDRCLSVEHARLIQGPEPPRA
jgi:predicted CoA-binding protein